MRRHPLTSLSALLAYATLGLGSRKTFNVRDDVLAFPQFEVVFPYEYILASDAQSLLMPEPSSKHSPTSSSPSPSASSTSYEHDYSDPGQVPLQDEKNQNEDRESESPSDFGKTVERYEEMVLDGMRYLCAIPKVVTINETEAAGTTPAEQENELARAADRGLELLSEMKDKCMYYVAGWWSYSFCYMDQVRQFHALPPGNGVPVYPPVEDPATHSYVLGRFRGGKGKEKEKEGSKNSGSSDSRPQASTDVAELQTTGDSRYLVQHLEDGTTCDLTGRDRKIEVQFHCHPQSTDRIGWIKEVSTCTYLMIIYTPRLCNDVAFQPPREDDPNHVVCREIITPDGVAEFEEAKLFHDTEQLVDTVTEAKPIIGDIEVGAMKLVGRDGKRLEKGKVVSSVKEKVEVVARREGGEVHKLSNEELKKFNLDTEKIESLKKQLEELAEGHDWKLEMVESNGIPTLRAVIDTGDEEGEEEGKGGKGKSKKAKKDQKDKNRADPDEAETGSDEAYKEEL
ncbi:Protein OS-9 [Onygenales sp. PD_40]|nr:Protein OS-9 [Onygenales sp. PD_40]